MSANLATTVRPQHPFDALTLELERADILAEHVAQQLDEMSEYEAPQRFLLAMALTVRAIRERHALIAEHARTLSPFVYKAAGGVQ
jgi:hypothetical protein